MEAWKKPPPVCCWKVCWWQLAMAGLCGVVEWAMEGACVHLVSTSGVLGFALPLCFYIDTCCFRLWEHPGKVTCLVFEEEEKSRLLGCS